MSPSLSQMKQRCRRARLVIEVGLWRQGAAWAVALAFACLGAVFCLAVVRPTAAKADALALELKTLQTAQRSASAPGASQATTAATASPTPLASLASVLRPRSASGEVIQRIYRLAEQEQVAVAQADFQDESPTAGVLRVTMRVPVTASYRQLRHFVEAVLRGLPNVSLDSMSFKRSEVAQAQVDAQLQWSIWLTATGPAQQEMPAHPLPERGL